MSLQHRIRVNFSTPIRTPIIRGHRPPCPPCPKGLNLILWEALYVHCYNHGFPDIREALVANLMREIQEEEDEKLLRLIRQTVHSRSSS